MVLRGGQGRMGRQAKGGWTGQSGFVDADPKRWDNVSTRSIRVSRSPVTGANGVAASTSWGS